MSTDPALRSNLGVGLLVDLLVHRRSTRRVDLHRRPTEADKCSPMIRDRRPAALRESSQTLPRPAWIGR